MPQVVADITMSLDGFVTGPDPDLMHGLGHGAEALHTWVFSDDEVDRAVLARCVGRAGAVLMGRNTFDVIDGPGGWEDAGGYGAGHDVAPPYVVVTHEPPARIRLPADRFTFVTDGVAAAVEAGRAAAGQQDVVIMGGGDLIGAALRAGLVDELSLHLAPMVVGGGAPLFGHPGPPLELVQAEVRVSSNATHLRYVRRTG